MTGLSDTTTDPTAGLLVFAALLLWMAFAAAAGTVFGYKVAIILGVLCGLCGLVAVIRA